MRKSYSNQTVTIKELDENGYGVGTSVETPKNIFCILNALPGETVEAEIHNQKKKLIFGNAVNIQNSSNYRVEGKEDHFTSCSPWQILDYNQQYNTKLTLLKKAFENYNVPLQSVKFQECAEENRWNYRNKVEYSFYTNKETEETSLSFFKRGSHFGKTPVAGCCLIHNSLDASANKILNWVKFKKLGGFQLKTVLLRSNLKGQVMGTLFIKDETFITNNEEIISLLDSTLIGFRVVFSNPLSPASIVTRQLASVGNLTLTENLLGLNFEFGADNFFQINMNEFSGLMEVLKSEVKLVVQKYFPENKNLVALDLYSGVGTIGLSLLDLFNKVKMVEISPESKKFTLLNAQNNNLDITKLEIWEGATENSLDILGEEDLVILDPPRSGLQGKVVDKLLETLPETIVYLSCNPFTQARDVSNLLLNYEIVSQHGFDLYPQTPHMENLLILKLK